MIDANKSSANSSVGSGNNSGVGGNGNEYVTEQFSLKWGNFEKCISTEFKNLQTDLDLVDITFICDGESFGAHKLLLFACSSYFKMILKANPCPHPIFYMNGIKPSVLRALLDFMYLGEVRISQEDLEGFLSLADQFKVRGVTKDSELNQSEAVKHSLDLLNEAQQRPLKQHKRSKHSTSSIASSVVGGEEIVVESEPHHHHHHHHQQQQQHQQQLQQQQQHQQQHHHHHQQQHHQSSKLMENVEPKTERPDITDETSCHPEFAHNSSGSTFGATESNAIVAASQSQRMFVLNPGYDETPGGGGGSSNVTESQCGDDEPWTEDKPHFSNAGSDGEQKHNKSKSQKTQCLVPSACPMCGRLYSNISNLRQHMRLIHNPTTVCCPICQKCFNSDLYLKRHYLSMHSNTTAPTTPGEKQPQQQAAVQPPPPPPPQQQQQQQQPQAPQTPNTNQMSAAASTVSNFNPDPIYGKRHSMPQQMPPTSTGQQQQQTSGNSPMIHLKGTMNQTTWNPYESDINNTMSID